MGTRAPNSIAPFRRTPNYQCITVYFGFGLWWKWIPQLVKNIPSSCCQSFSNVFTLYGYGIVRSALLRACRKITTKIIEINSGGSNASIQFHLDHLGKWHRHLRREQFTLSNKEKGKKKSMLSQANNAKMYPQNVGTDVELCVWRPFDLSFRFVRLPNFKLSIKWEKLMNSFRVGSAHDTHSECQGAGE